MRNNQMQCLSVFNALEYIAIHSGDVRENSTVSICPDIPGSRAVGQDDKWSLRPHHRTFPSIVNVLSSRCLFYILRADN